MPVILDHALIPVRDKIEAATFFAKMFDVPFLGVEGPFAMVKVNDTLTLDFADDVEPVVPHHYGFLVSDEEFDAIVGRVRAAGVPHGAGLDAGYDGQINCENGGRGVYFVDPSGHSYELLTRTASGKQ